MVDSASGYVGCVPLRSKGQLELMTREVLSFTAGLGHAEVIFRCDNEPTMRQLLKYVVSTRLSMGLATRSVTPPAYSHGNSLVENVIGRLRPLASILMHSVRKRTGIDFSTNHALWTWAHRHAAWLMNRYGVVRNVTPFELVHKKHYRIHCSVCRAGFWVFSCWCKGDSKVAQSPVFGESGWPR